MPATVRAADINGQLSHEDIRCLVQQALTNGAELCYPCSPWVIDTADGQAIVNRDGDTWRYPFTISADGESVELGVPVRTRLSWQDEIGPAAAVAAREPEAGTRAFVTALEGLRFSEGETATRIEVCRDGTWQHARHGELRVTPELRNALVENFQGNAREVGDLPLDYDHEAGPAPGWITGLTNDGNSLFADVRLTPSGRQKIADGEYRFFSPEWHPDWENPRTGTKHGPTLFGGALTNKPFFRGMAAVSCSEVPPHSGADATAGDPGKENRMSATATQPGTQTGAEPPVNAQQFAELQARLTAVETENLTLRAREDRAAVEGALNTLRFSEGRFALAPAGRTTLADAVLGITSTEQRKAVMAALGTVQLAEMGERGFVTEETAAGETLTAAEEQSLREMADRNGMKFEELRAARLIVRKERGG